jgi:hypothetical protein
MSIEVRTTRIATSIGSGAIVAFLFPGSLGVFIPTDLFFRFLRVFVFIGAFVSRREGTPPNLSAWHKRLLGLFGFPGPAGGLTFSQSDRTEDL